MGSIHLTDRFLEYLEEVYQFSITEWDEIVADKYLLGIETALNLLQENSEILVHRPSISNRFLTHPVNNHWLICEVIGDQIFGLTLLHSSLNVLERLQKYEPSLEKEAQALFNQLSNKRNY